MINIIIRHSRAGGNPIYYRSFVNVGGELVEPPYDSKALPLASSGRTDSGFSI